MSKFNLMHCIPNPKLHGLNGYKEVIDTIKWGLSELGHDARYALNSYDPSATNIIFGAQLLPIDVLKKLPGDTIIYNLEQNYGVPKKQFNEAVCFYAKHFQIWEYSAYNLDSWKMLGAHNPKLVPIGYAPILTCIPKPDEQDIDIFIYGLSGKKRLDAFHVLSQHGFKVLFASGLYGEARDALIARSKIILNMNLSDRKIFEIVRVSYLLANKKAIVSIFDKNTVIEKDILETICFIPFEKIIDICSELIENDNERIMLENNGYQFIIKQDIREILKKALY